MKFIKMMMMNSKCTLFMNEEFLSRVTKNIDGFCFENDEYSFVINSFIKKNSYNESLDISSLECFSKNIYSIIYSLFYGYHCLIRHDHFHSVIHLIFQFQIFTLKIILIVILLKMVNNSIC